MGDNGSSSTSINIEQLCQQLVKEAPDSMETEMLPKTCIYRVPEYLRRGNENAYAPRVISIGPVHHKDEDHAMKTLKRRYFTKFFKRQADVKKREEFRRKFVSTIKDNDVKIRICYQDEASELCEEPEEFLKMISWDAVFILELFLKTREYKLDENKSQDKYKYDYIIGKPWLTAAIQRDLILLENQLPFWILEKLYKLATDNIKPDCHSFLKLSCEYFENYNKNQTKPPATLHFTDLVRYFLSSEHPMPNGLPISNLYRATRLHQAGMKFKCMRNECLLNIRAWSTEPEEEGNEEPQVPPVALSPDPEREGEPYEPLIERRTKTRREGNPIKKGELHIPRLEIDDSTECLLRNLMLLEQCHYPYEAYICQYVKFLDFLVDTVEDADLLIESKVIINKLGESAAVAELINKLCLGNVEISSCYDGLATELNNYYNSTFNRSIAYLRRVYFRNVWIGTGTFVGLIVLFITLAQFALSFS